MRVVLILWIVGFNSLGFGNTITNDERVALEKTVEVAPGFLFRISHRDDEKISGSFRINYNGILRLPYGVRIDTRGMTMDMLKEHVIKSYRHYYSSGAPVSFKLTQKRYWIDIQGLVQKPGKQLVKFRTSIDEIRVLAGGFLQNNLPDSVRITQQEETDEIKLVDYNLGTIKSPNWYGGDLVFFLNAQQIAGFEESHVVKIMGEVKLVNEVKYVDGADFFYYLAKANGPTTQADLTRVRIIHWNAKVRQEQWYDLSSAEAMPSIFPGDLIVVEPLTRTGWEKFLSYSSTVTSLITSVIMLTLLF